MSVENREKFVSELLPARSASTFASSSTNRPSLLEQSRPVGLIAEAEADDTHNRYQPGAIVLSPINRLPPELLGKIFIYTLPNLNKQIGIRKSFATVPPLLLCQISRLWRDIAISLPQLWQKLTLYYEANTSVSRATCWLNRASAAYPAIVEIKKVRNRKDETPPSAEYLQQFAPIIGTLIFNWFNTYPIINYSKFISQPVVSYPLLRSVAIIGACGEDIRSYALRIKNVFHDSTWSRLTQLTINQRIDILVGCKLLSLCYSLLHCKMHFVCTADILVGPSIETQVLPSLHTFIINISSIGTSWAYSHLFDALTLPALKRLHLSVDSCGRDIDSRFMAFKQRSSLDLSSFFLFDAYADIGGPAVAEFLRDMPSLTSIEIHDATRFGPGCVTPHFLHDLSRRISGQRSLLAPNLTELTVTVRSLDSIRELCDMVDSRCPPEIGLSSRSETYLMKVHLKVTTLSLPEYAQAGASLKRRAEIWRARGVDFELQV